MPVLKQGICKKACMLPPAPGLTALAWPELTAWELQQNNICYRRKPPLPDDCLGRSSSATQTRS